MSFPAKIRFMTLNCENLFLGSPNANHIDKSATLIKGLASTILHHSPDVVFLSELGGIESLQNFNHRYLDDSYETSLVPGNSERGIELGILKKKNLSLLGRHLSHRERKLTNDATIFSEQNSERYFRRDCAEYHLFDESDESKRIIVFFVHLKSQWDRSGEDFRGFKQRSAEVRTLIEILKERQKDFPQGLFFLTGDFNGNAGKENPDREFLPLYQETSLQDLFDWRELPQSERRTASLFDQRNELLSDKHLQLDYLFFPPECLPYMDLKNSARIPFINEQGKHLPFPHTPQAKKALPSDHFPIVWELKSLERV